MSGSVDRSDPGELVDFFVGLPRRVAEEPPATRDLEATADALDRLVQLVESAGFPPDAVDGPEPNRFDGDLARIVGAANQLRGQLTGLDPDGWSTDVGDETVAAACHRTRDQLVEELPGLH